MAMAHITNGTRKYIDDFRQRAEADNPTRLKPEDRDIRVSTSPRQARIRIERPLWEALGEPARVEVSKIDGEEWQIKPNQAGFKLIVENNYVYTQITPKNIGLSPAKRPMIKVEARIKKKVLYVTSPSEGWIGGTIEPETTEEDTPTEPELTAEATTAPPTEPSQHDTHDPQGIGLSTYKNGNNCGFFVKIRDELHQAIGSPGRMVVTGTVHEGMWIQAAPNPNAGVKIQAGTGWVGAAVGIRATGITEKCQRKTIWVRGTVIGDRIKVAGPNFEWIRGAECWRPNTRKQRSDAVRHIDPASYRVSPAPGDQPLPSARTPDAATEMQTRANGNGHFQGTDAHGKGLGMVTVPIANGTSAEKTGIIKTLLRTAADDFLKLKEDLENITGMKFTVDQKLNLRVVM